MAVQTPLKVHYNNSTVDGLQQFSTTDYNYTYDSIAYESLNNTNAFRMNVGIIPAGDNTKQEAGSFIDYYSSKRPGVNGAAEIQTTYNFYQNVVDTTDNSPTVIPLANFLNDYSLVRTVATTTGVDFSITCRNKYANPALSEATVDIQMGLGDSSSVKTTFIQLQYERDFVIIKNPTNNLNTIQFKGASSNTFKNTGTYTHFYFKIHEPPFQQEVTSLANRTDTFYKQIIQRWKTNVGVGSVKIQLDDWTPPQGETWRKECSFDDTVYSDTVSTSKTTYAVWRKMGPLASAVYPIKGVPGENGGYQEILSPGAGLYKEFIYWCQLNELGRLYISKNSPTLTGTWTDLGSSFVEQTVPISNVYFSGTYVSPTTYTGSFTGSYAGAYARSRDVSYTGSYTSAYTGVYAGTYTKNYSGGYSATYSGSYTGTYASNYAGTYVGYFNRNFTRTFSRTVDTASSSSYSKTVSSSYAGTAYSGSYTRYRDGPAYAKDILLPYARTRNVPQYYVRGFFTTTHNYAGTRYQNFALVYNTRVAGNYAGLRYLTFSKELRYARYFIGYLTYTGSYTGISTLYYVENFVGSYIGTYRAQYAGSRTSYYNRYFTGTATQYYSGASYATAYSKAFSGSYAGSRAKSFGLTRTLSYTRYRDVAYTGQYTGVYSSTYSGVYTANYSGSYTGIYTGIYSKAFSRLFSGTYANTQASSTPVDGSTLKLWMRTA